jgi:hypothetical protein
VVGPGALGLELLLDHRLHFRGAAPAGAHDPAQLRFMGARDRAVGGRFVRERLRHAAGI